MPRYQFSEDFSAAVRDFQESQSAMTLEDKRIALDKLATTDWPMQMLKSMQQFEAQLIQMGGLGAVLNSEDSDKETSAEIT